MSTGRTRTQTTHTTMERRELARLIRQRKLTDKQEQVLRMRYGVSEPHKARLQFRGEAVEETRIKLAMMEREFMVELRADTAGEPELDSRKARIIEKLRTL